MIVILKNGTTVDQVNEFSDIIKNKYNVDIHSSYGEHSVILGFVGDTKAIDIDSISAYHIVESVRRCRWTHNRSA